MRMLRGTRHSVRCSVQDSKRPLMDESEVLANSVFVELGGLSMNDWFPKTPNAEGLPKK